eukprot:15433913-Alexandrium_andersonii.AAC.1
MQRGTVHTGAMQRCNTDALTDTQTANTDTRTDTRTDPTDMQRGTQHCIQRVRRLPFRPPTDSDTRADTVTRTAADT